MEATQSIAIIGGTFDPIHTGHLAIADAVRQEMGVGRILFVPAASPPHKNSYSDPSRRYEMVLLATASNPHFFVSDIELVRKGGASYTIDTVRELRAALGDDTRLLFITGADALLDIFSWEKPEELLRECEFVAVTRPGYDTAKLQSHIRMLVEKYGARIRFLEVPPIDVSSTDIRLKVLVGKSPRYLVPDVVIDYLNKHELYRFGSMPRPAPIASMVQTAADVDTIKARLARELSQDRYEHSLGVAEAATRLAQAYGEDAETAFLIGLLHDIAKEWTPDHLIKYCNAKGVHLDALLLEEPVLSHGHAGEALARDEYGLHHTDALSAIRNHTIGRPSMSVMEKILFVADLIEPSRTHTQGDTIACGTDGTCSTASYIGRIRELACQEHKLDEAVYHTLLLKRHHTLSKGQAVHPLAEEALKYYKTPTTP